MKFSNLSPADRMKASGLICLIGVAMFWIVYTMLGIISPKKPAPVNPVPPSSASGAPPVIEQVAASATPASGFAGKTTPAGKGLSGDPLLAQDMHDPFDPLVTEKEKATPTPPAVKNSQPVVDVYPAGSQARSASPGGFSPLPAMETSAQPVVAPIPTAIVPPPPQPEIKVVGIVHGEPSVATLQVAGRIVLARPGDALAKGYRLMTVDPEGVVIRHEHDYLTLRVGASINEAKTEK